MLTNRRPSLLTLIDFAACDRSAGRPRTMVSGPALGSSAPAGSVKRTTASSYPNHS